MKRFFFLAPQCAGLANWCGKCDRMPESKSVTRLWQQACLRGHREARGTRGQATADPNTPHAAATLSPVYPPLPARFFRPVSPQRRLFPTLWAMCNRDFLRCILAAVRPSGEICLSYLFWCKQIPWQHGKLFLFSCLWPQEVSHKTCRSVIQATEFVFAAWSCSKAWTHYTNLNYTSNVYITCCRGSNLLREVADRCVCAVMWLDSGQRM